MSDEALATWIVTGEHSREPSIAKARTRLLRWLRADNPYEDGELARYGPNAPRFRFIEEVPESPVDRWYAVPIGELQLTVRAYNLLYDANIKTVGRLMEKRKYDIQRLPYSGLHTADEIAIKLKKLTGFEMEP